MYTQYYRLEEGMDLYVIWRRRMFLMDSNTLWEESVHGEQNSDDYERLSKHNKSNSSKKTMFN